MMAKAKNNVKILVATHKPYAMPKSEIYLPIQVGKKLTKTSIVDFIGDDTGENISEKNPVFCELTALYWAWKNLDTKYVGLAHYRRHFKNPKGHEGNDVVVSTDVQDIETATKAIPKLQKTLSPTAAEELLQSTDVILPKKRNYYIENLYDHYCKTMNPEPLIKVREIIANQYPEYLIEFDLLKQRRSAHVFNMLIMKKDILNNYCNWLFPILFELEKQVNTEGWSGFQKRYAGRISERLLDVWINTNQIPYKELPVIDIETVNWLKKGTGFLKAKFLRRQYEKSW